MLPTKFEVIDETIFRKEQKNGKFPFSIHIYNEDDIKLSIKESDFSHKIKCVTLSENNVIIDTLVVSETYFSYRKWENNRAVDYYDSRKIKPQISYSKYRENYLQSNGSYKNAQRTIEQLTKKYTNALKQAKQDFIEYERQQNEEEERRIREEKERKIREEKERQEAIEREKLQKEAERKRILGNYEFEFFEPTSPIKTKTYTNYQGAQISYQYYINESGYETYHGKFTMTMNFKNQRYWVGGNIGFITVNGIETVTYYYKNGIVHGNFSYKRNLKTKSTYNTLNSILNQTYNFPIYKNFISGNFNFEHKGIKYHGKAINGILEYCNYEAGSGYHGTLKSNPKSQYLSIAQIHNGFNTFEFDEFQLQSIIVSIPHFRFPLIGEE